MCTELICCQRLQREENFLEHRGQSQVDGKLGWQAELGEDPELEALATVEKSLGLTESVTTGETTGLAACR